MSDPSLRGAATFRAQLLRAARKDRPSRDSAERVLAAALLVSLETCASSRSLRARSPTRDLLRRFLVPLSVLTLAGDPSPRPLPVAPSPPPVASTPPVASSPSVPVPIPVPVPILFSPPPIAAPSQAPSELSLLRRARASLPADPAAALSILSTHARLYPHGFLREEAEALRVDALFASNDLRTARAAAARFLAAHPRSPYTQRVQTVAARAAAHDD